MTPSRELLGRQYRGIDLAAHDALRAGEPREELFERHIRRDHEKIDVAAGVSLIPRDGSVDEREIDLSRERSERIAQRLGNAARLDDNRAKLRKNRAGAVGAVVSLISDRCDEYDPESVDPLRRSGLR